MGLCAKFLYFFILNWRIQAEHTYVPITPNVNDKGHIYTSIWPWSTGHFYGRKMIILYDTVMVGTEYISENPQNVQDKEWTLM